MFHSLKTRKFDTYAFAFKRGFFYAVRGRRRTRDSTLVQKTYDRGWGDAAGRIKKLTLRNAPKLGVRAGSLVLYQSIDIHKHAISRMSELMRWMRPERVLEAGCGDGLNLLSLAALHPEVRVWRGIDFSESAKKNFEAMREHIPFAEISYLTNLSDLIIQERIARADIAIDQGDMRALHYADASYDLVFSHYALEQAPRDYQKALREIKRVAKKYACFVEPFAEAQTSMFHRLHLWNADYFRASIREVEKAGLRIIRFEPLSLQKVEFGTGLLMCGIDVAISNQQSAISNQLSEREK